MVFRIGRRVIRLCFVLSDPQTTTTFRETDNRGEEIASQATMTQHEIQTTILISIFPWQDAFMQKREEAEVSRLAVYKSSGLFLYLLNPGPIYYLWLRFRRVPFSTGRHKRSNQKNREECRSTYLPLHRPLHAASVQSKSRTETISDPTEQPVHVHKAWRSKSTFTGLGRCYGDAAEVP